MPEDFKIRLKPVASEPKRPGGYAQESTKAQRHESTEKNGGGLEIASQEPRNDNDDS